MKRKKQKMPTRKELRDSVRKVMPDTMVGRPFKGELGYKRRPKHQKKVDHE